MLEPKLGSKRAVRELAHTFFRAVTFGEPQASVACGCGLLIELDVGAAVAAADQDEGGDQAEDRQAERAADLLGGVDQAAGQALLAVGDAGDGGDRDRHEGEAEADRRQQRGAEDVGEEGAVDRDLGEPDQAERDQPMPVARIGLKPTFVTNCEAIPAERMIETASGR